MPSRASAPQMTVPMLPAPPVTTATPRSSDACSEGIISVASHFFNTTVVYFHHGVTALNLIQNRLAYLRRIIFKNKVTNSVEGQFELAVLHKLVKQITKSAAAFGEKYRSKSMQPRF